jgi:hypothetical protein
MERARLQQAVQQDGLRIQQHFRLKLSHFVDSLQPNCSHIVLMIWLIYLIGLI